MSNINSEFKKCNFCYENCPCDIVVYINKTTSQTRIQDQLSFNYDNTNDNIHFTTDTTISKKLITSTFCR